MKEWGLLIGAVGLSAFPVLAGIGSPGDAAAISKARVDLGRESDVFWPASNCVDCRPGSGNPDCLASTSGADVVFYDDDLYGGRSHGLHLGECAVFDDCVTWRVLNAGAAVRARCVSDVFHGRTGPYDAFLYSEQDQPFIGDAFQYCSADFGDPGQSCNAFEVSAVARDLPQPALLVPVDLTSIHRLADPRSAGYLACHRMLVLRKAYFWENSEEVDCSGTVCGHVVCHGPYGDLKIAAFDPGLDGFSFERLFFDHTLWEGLRLCDHPSDDPNSRVNGAKLPGPIWSGFAPGGIPYGEDPFSEWIDGPWGCAYSNIAVWDWDGSDRGAQMGCTDRNGSDRRAQIALGVYEADSEALNCGSPADLMGWQLVNKTDDEILLHVRTYGWVLLQNIDVPATPGRQCGERVSETSVARADVPDPEHDGFMRGVYWYPGWDGSYPEEVYGPPTVACPQYPDYEACQRWPGSQYLPFTDNAVGGREGFFDFLSRTNFPDDVLRVGLLGTAQPLPVMGLHKVMAFRLQNAPPAISQGEALPDLNVSLYNYAPTPVPGPQSVHFLLSPDPLTPDPAFATDDVDLGVFSAAVEVAGKQFRSVAADGIRVACTLPPREYYLGARVNDGPASSPVPPVTIEVEPDTTAPQVDCPSDVTVECAGPLGVPKDSPELAAFFRDMRAQDACLDAVGNDAPDAFPFGSTDVTFTASDLTGHESSCTATVTVQDTTPPQIVCPPDILVECSARGGTPRSDPQLRRFFGGIIVQDRCDGNVRVSHDAPEFFPLGSTRVTFRALDARGNAASCGSAVTVQDTIPPVITASVNPQVLSPANGRLRLVTARVDATDVCSPPQVALESIFSNSSAFGIADAEYGTPDFSFLLAAQSPGVPRLRTYTITYAATDASGNPARTSVQVFAPARP